MVMNWFLADIDLVWLMGVACGFWYIVLRIIIDEAVKGDKDDRNGCG